VVFIDEDTLFNMFDVFTREWVGHCFDLSAVKENAIISIEIPF